MFRAHKLDNYWTKYDQLEWKYIDHNSKECHFSFNLIPHLGIHYGTSLMRIIYLTRVFFMKVILDYFLVVYWKIKSVYKKIYSRNAKRHKRKM